MTIEESVNQLRERLKDRNLMEVSRNIGVSYLTIYSFANLNKNVRLDNLIAIEQYLNQHQ